MQNTHSVAPNMASLSLKISHHLLRRKARSNLANIKHILKTLSSAFFSSKISTFLSRLTKNYLIHVPESIFDGVDIDYAAMAEDAKRRRQQRAKEVKRLNFPSVLVKRKPEKRRHILDDFEFNYWGMESNEWEEGERSLQYTDAFREGNVLYGMAFEDHGPNPVCNPRLFTFLFFEG
jgi:hypothetical protein